MATPIDYTNESGAHVDVSHPELLQRLEDLSESSASQADYDESSLPSPTSTVSWSPSRRHPANAWVGGSLSAREARDKLRAADEARWLKAAVNTIDGSPDLSTPSSRLNASMFDSEEVVKNGDAQQHIARFTRSPDPVGHPHDYAEYMMEGSPLSTPDGHSPALHRHDGAPSVLQYLPASEIISAPSSSLISNNDIFLDEIPPSSPRSKHSQSSAGASASTTVVSSVKASRTTFDGTSMWLPHSFRS